jgi:hypothetical protein
MSAAFEACATCAAASQMSLMAFFCFWSQSDGPPGMASVRAISEVSCAMP